MTCETRTTPNITIVILPKEQRAILFIRATGLAIVLTSEEWDNLTRK